MPLRSCFVLRAEGERLLKAALSSGAAALLFELSSIDETARRKERAWAREALAEARSCAPEREPSLYVRVAPAESNRVDADLAAVMPAAPDGVFLEDARGRASVQQIAAKLAVCEAEAGLPDGATRIVALAAQTGAGVFGLGTYAGASRRLAALAFDDAAVAGPGAVARSLLLLGAASAGVGAFDAAGRGFVDMDAMRASCEAARRDGFAGKAGFTAGEIAVIREVFG
jgi:citrate lyase subunit beta/citryl-CoA lyase